MAKRKHKFIWHFLITIGMCLCIWLASLYPVDKFDFLGYVSWWICGVIAMIGFVLLYFKRLRHILILLLCCMLSFSAIADDEECVKEYEASPEAGNLCVYNTTKDKYGSKICSYMKKFDPRGRQSVEKQKRMVEHLNLAEELIQAYEALTPEQKGEEDPTANCSLVEAANKQDVDDRIKELKQNNSALCCAYALQTLNQIATGSSPERRLETVPMLLTDEKMQCWACDIVYLVIVLANTVSKRVEPAVCYLGIQFLAIAMAFWILIKVGMLLFNRDLSGKAYGAGQFFPEFLKQILYVSFVAMILAGPASRFNPASGTRIERNAPEDDGLLGVVYNDILNPIFEFIAGFGVELSNHLFDGQGDFYTDLTNRVSDYSIRNELKRVDYCGEGSPIRNSGVYNKLINSTSYGSRVNLLTGKGQVIGPNLINAMLCMTQMPVRGVAPISASGSLFISYAIANAKKVFLLPLRIPWPFLYIIYGIIILIACWFLSLIISFRLIDIIIRLAIVVILCPIFLALATFAVTRKYAQNAWDFFLGALMGFVEMALATGIIVPFFYTALNSGGSRDELLKLMAAPFSKDYVPNIYDKFTDKGFWLVIYLLGACWLATYIMKVTSAFFSKLGFGGIVSDKSGATMTGAFNASREFVGSAADFTKKMGGNLKKLQGPKNEKKGAGGGGNTGGASVHKRNYEEWKQRTRAKMEQSKLGRGALYVADLRKDNAVFRKARKIGNTVKDKYGKVKTKVKNAYAKGKTWVRNRKTVQWAGRQYNAARNSIRDFKAWRKRTRNRLVEWKNRNVRRLKEWFWSRKTVQWTARKYNAVRAWGGRQRANFRALRHRIGNRVVEWKNRNVRRLKEWFWSRKTVQWSARKYNAGRQMVRDARAWGGRQAASLKAWTLRQKPVQLGIRGYNAAKKGIKAADAALKNAKDWMVNFAKDNMVMRGLGHFLIFMGNNKLTRGVSHASSIVRGAVETNLDTKAGRAAQHLVNNRVTRFMVNNEVTKFGVDQVKKGTHQFFHPDGE